MFAESIGSVDWLSISLIESKAQSSKISLGEINADLRGFSPSHAAVIHGRLVKHEIKHIRNSNGLSTLRQAPRSERLRTVQSIVELCPLKMMCAPFSMR